MTLIDKRSNSDNLTVFFKCCIALSLGCSITAHCHEGEVHSAGDFSGDLNKLIPSLYGGDGIFLDESPFFSHSAHFTGDSLDRLNTLSESLDSITIPSIASQAGVVYVYDGLLDDYILKPSSFNASIFAEDANTIGESNWGFNITATTMKFTEFDGEKLSKTQVDLNHFDIDGDGNQSPCIAGDIGSCYAFEQDLVRLNLDIDLEVNTIYFQSTYGLTDNTEIGITIPYHRTRLDVSSVASVVEGPTQSFADFHLHRFEGTADSPRSELRGEKNGLGDIVIRTKSTLHDSDTIKWAAVSDIRFATGDENNYQGLERMGFGIGSIVSGTFNVDNFILNPRVKIEYKTNTGTNNQHDVEYSVGSSVSFTSRATKTISQWALSLDIIGSRTVRNKSKYSYERHDLSGGIGWQYSDNILVVYNVMVPLDNNGIRADYIHAAKISFQF